MSLLAAHLNDANITVVNGSEILYRAPGFALLEDAGLVTGQSAYNDASLHPRRIQNRYWHSLTVEPLSDQRFCHLSAADLVSEQLADMWRSVSDHGDQLAIAVPPYMNNENLGLLLGIAMDRKIPIIAMVDAAVCATRRHYENAVVAHVDLSLHAALLTRLTQGTEVQVDRTSVIESSGLLSLYSIWLKVIAETFVQRSRFDPLHTAETEQSLQQSMPHWLQAASSQQVVSMAVEYGGVRHEVEVESLELVAAAAPIYQSIASSLRAMFKAEELPAIQLTERAARLPGLADTLKARVGGEVYFLEPGATARGLLARTSTTPTESGVHLVRRLPWDQASISVTREERATQYAQPTHLLHGHEALHLGDEPLIVGSQNLNGERFLDLGQDVPGVSRRHCSIGFDNGQPVVRDFSRYGTFLNGHRIDGTATLQVGDVIRVGMPGYEMRLIRAEGRHGA